MNTDQAAPNAGRLRTRLRRRLLRGLRGEQDRRWYQRLLLAQIRRTLRPMLEGDAIAQLVDAGQVRVAAGIARLEDDVNEALLRLDAAEV